MARLTIAHMRKITNTSSPVAFISNAQATMNGEKYGFPNPGSSTMGSFGFQKLPDSCSSVAAWTNRSFDAGKMKTVGRKKIHRTKQVVLYGDNVGVIRTLGDSTSSRVVQSYDYYRDLLRAP